jgi:hypothetical protein
LRAFAPAAADLAGLLQGGDRRGGLGAGLLLLGLVKVFMGTLFAQVQFFPLVVGEHLGDVQRGGLGTLLALHRRDPHLSDKLRHF